MNPYKLYKKRYKFVYESDFKGSISKNITIKNQILKGD